MPSWGEDQGASTKIKISKLLAKIKTHQDQAITSFSDSQYPNLSKYLQEYANLALEKFTSHILNINKK